jgi:DNA primase
MGKINPVSSKYIIHATIKIDGVVDRPDVIGAIFGQTEGLLGADLELRELQRSGRIGRIEVETETKSGKTAGTIVIPSSLDKAETAIVAASLEIIQRIGPCNAKIEVQNIEDIRISKRNFVIDRAKELLKQLVDTVMPDSQEISDEVAASVRVMEIQEYGRERLPAGPAVDESDDVIVVEGRADVINLLKHGFKNTIAINGTSIPLQIVELAKSKVITVFVDGDRGGELIVQELLSLTDIDFVAKAPDGKEVEEITKKEIHKALRARISAEQFKLDHNGGSSEEKREARRRPAQQQQQPQAQPKPVVASVPQAVPPKTTKKDKSDVSEDEKSKYSEILDSLVGTRGAYILDQKLDILGKVPVSELSTTIKSLTSGVYAIVFDGSVDKEILSACEKSNIKVLVGMDSAVKQHQGINILTAEEFS